MANNEYPRMVYADDGRSETVHSQEEEDALEGTWSREPSDIHRSFPNPGATNVQPSGDEAFARLVADIVVTRLLEETANRDAESPRRGPGRPPKTSI